MRAALIIILLSIIFSSCDNQKHEPIILTDGTYTGTFQRSGSDYYHEISDVTLVLNGDTYEGSSSITKYPAICRGTFTMKDQKVEFVNECPWTAEFDWTFILAGEFNISTEGEAIIMQRSYGEGIYDTYILRKQ